MGCSSSKAAGGGVVPPSAAPAGQRQGLRSRSQTRAASALTSFGMCRGGHDGVHAYTALPFDEPVTGAHDPATAEDKALAGEEAAPAEEKRRHDAPSTAAAATASLEDAALATPSWTPAQWRAEPPALDLDPAVLPGFRQPVEAPSPSHPALLFPEQDKAAPHDTAEEISDVDMGTPAARDIPEVTCFVRERVDDYGCHEKVEKNKAAVAVAASEKAPAIFHGAADVTTLIRRRLLPPRAGKPVVLYFTSLRGVRRTFEDCRAVRAILRCYWVRVDERDVSMHAAFKSELAVLLGTAGVVEGPALPRVFVDGRHDLGGGEDVRALHEAGELARWLAGYEAAGHAGAVGACVACGEARFVPCEICHGSCKVFVDGEGCRLAGFFRRCPDCNENGLIRCPVCFY